MAESSAAIAGSRTLPGWLQAQVKSVLKGGLPALGRKIWLLIKCIVAVPLVVIVRCLRPLVLIRFGRLISGRIGHFAMNTEICLCKRDLDPPRRRYIDIFCLSGFVCNQQLLKMWARKLHIRSFADPMLRVNGLLAGGDIHTITLSTDWDPDGVLTRVPPHIQFTQEEEARGACELQELGIPGGSPFICFDARDPCYLDRTFPHTDWRYHDYRDADVKNCMPAAKEMVRRGYSAVRMGAAVREPLTFTEPGIVDYATTGRSDFMDIYLCAKCSFFMGSSGLRIVPNIFRRPVVFLNLVPLSHFWGVGPSQLVLPKKYWSRSERRFLTFREILASDLGGYGFGELFDQAGVELIENTADEITAAAIEMHERIRGTWQTTGEDEELQQRFLALFKPLGWKKTVSARIGADFLKQNSAFLE